MTASRARVLAEIEHRMDLLPREIARIQAAVAANESGFKIHTTQVDVLRLTLDELFQRQRAFLTGLDGDMTDADFAENLWNLVFEEVTGAQTIWETFAQAFSARRQPELASFLDTADLVANDCYQVCLDRAQSFGAIDASSRRVPPLVCPTPFGEPTAYGQGALFRDLRYVNWRFHDLLLPLPLVFFPVDQLTCIWLLPMLCHEVGHQVDKDLQVSNELGPLLATAQALPPERRAAWNTWCKEVVADVFGVLLGNTGFAQTLASLLVVLAPAPAYQTFCVDAKHAHPLLRVRTVSALLRRLGAPALADTLARLEADARALPAPEGLAPFYDDVDVVAATLLDTKLGALHGHAMAELNPNVASDAKSVSALAGFLAHGMFRPAPDKPSPFPYRLVPAAAQLAFVTAAPGPASLDTIQQRATEFVAAIPRPAFLDGGTALTAKRKTFLADVARRINFKGES
ncbi:Hypothetical protein A7982_05385 [Minicystis rosea]|nr:Hypothetical protein A7982_05385 [Minicystis rosea]